MTAKPAPIYLRTLQFVYDLFYAGIVLLSSPVIAALMLISGRWRTGLWQRLGFCDERTSEGPAVWIHGVSVGEVLAAKELVHQIEREMPWLEIVLSTTTATGQQAVRRQYPGKQHFFFPTDFSFATRRVLSRVRPSVVLLMELEIWPNFLLSTFMRDIPVMLANGRMSQKSARDYRTLMKLIPEPMGRVSHYCVQSQEYGDRFHSLGVPADRITITGSMKFDNLPDSLPPEVRRDYAETLRIADGAFVLMGGSTHGHEEILLVDVYEQILERDPGARLVLCPRHPQHRDEVESMLRGRGFGVVRLTALRDGSVDTVPDRAVVLVDTVGELGRLYILADLVFVGGSLTKRGGQNMMEPAGLGKAVVVGPNTWNFRDPVELLLTAGGLLQVPDAESLKRELLALHGDPERRRALGEHARRVCLESKGATRRILEILREYVPPPPAVADRDPATFEGSTS